MFFIVIYFLCISPPDKHLCFWGKCFIKYVYIKKRKNKTKIFTVMCFVEPIVCLFAIRYLNMYVYFLFAKTILLDTIYSLKFLRSCFYSIIRTLKYSIFLKS